MNSTLVSVIRVCGGQQTGIGLWAEEAGLSLTYVV